MVVRWEDSIGKRLEAVEDRLGRKLQACQVSRIARVTHAIGSFHTLTRKTGLFSRILLMPGTRIWPAVLQVSEIVESKLAISNLCDSTFCSIKFECKNS